MKDYPRALSDLNQRLLITKPCVSGLTLNTGIALVDRVDLAERFVHRLFRHFAQQDETFQQATVVTRMLGEIIVGQKEVEVTNVRDDLIENVDRSDAKDRRCN